jgi:hypothetical protein
MVQLPSPVEGNKNDAEQSGNAVEGYTSPTIKIL